MYIVSGYENMEGKCRNIKPMAVSTKKMAEDILETYANTYMSVAKGFGDAVVITKSSKEIVVKGSFYEAGYNIDKVELDKIMGA